MLIFPQKRTYTFDDLFSGPPPHGGYGGPPPHGPPPPGVSHSDHPSIQPWDPSDSSAPPDFGGEGLPPIDDPECLDPVYPPPSTDDLPTLPGYEKVTGFKQAQLVPAPDLSQQPDGQPPVMEIDQIANLNEDQCRGAILNFVGERCCYGKRAAVGMEFAKILPMSAFHYTLETFCESRSVCYAYVPYEGGLVDGPEFGEPPLPWDIPCSCDQKFHDHNKEIEVPHTAVLKDCHCCEARGWSRCHRCHGKTQVRCHQCHGRGHVRRYDPEQGHVDAPCYACGTDGKKRCGRCGGDGRIVCSGCRGFKRLKCFIQLTVSFVNYYDDYILEKTDVPEELIRHVGSTVIMTQTMPHVYPITNYPIVEICNSSVRLVNEHRQKYSAQKQLTQRQQLSAVPVTEALYKWREKTSRFWVYGVERKVYAPDYPQRSCWGCAVM